MNSFKLQLQFKTNYFAIIKYLKVKFRTKYIVNSVIELFGWICSQCHLVTIKTFDANVTHLPEIHHLNSCIKWCDIKIACEKAYNNLKDQPKFQFPNQYESALLQLQVKYDNNIVSQYWPDQKMLIVFNLRKIIHN